MGRYKSYFSKLTIGSSGKMCKRITSNCNSSNKLVCLLNNDLFINNSISNTNIVLKDNTIDFIILFTFDMPSNLLWNEHPKMLIMSILSCIREFKKYNFKIIIYTTNVEPLFNYLKQFNINEYIIIKKYSPLNYGLQKSIPLGINYEPFINGIGHARIFVLKELREQYKCPIVYMDNDTGISLGNGEECFNMIKNTKTIRYYLLEKWVTFSELYSKMGLYEELIRLHKKFPSIIKPNIEPRNNGIIIFGYTNNNEVSNLFVENAIVLIENIYKIISKDLICHYNDMFAFSLVCDMLLINESIGTIIHNIKNESSFKFILKNIPIFIHYYMDKYNNMYLIKYIFDRILDLHFKKKPLIINNDSQVVNSNFMLTYVFSNKTIQDESLLFLNNIYS